VNSKIAVVSCALLALSTFASAQVGPAFLGSGTAFERSRFCTQQASCKAVGTIRLADGEVRSFYTIKLKKRQAYGLDAYTVYFSSRKGLINEVAIVYPPAQDGVEDGAFYTAFVGAMTGYDLSTTKQQFIGCDLRIRGKSMNFYVADNIISHGYGGEKVVTITAFKKDDDQMFSEIPASVRLFVGGTC